MEAAHLNSQQCWCRRTRLGVLGNWASLFLTSGLDLQRVYWRPNLRTLSKLTYWGHILDITHIFNPCSSDRLKKSLMFYLQKSGKFQGWWKLNIFVESRISWRLRAAVYVNCWGVSTLPVAVKVFWCWFTIKHTMLWPRSYRARAGQEFFKPRPKVHLSNRVARCTQSFVTGVKKRWGHSAQ